VTPPDESDLIERAPTGCTIPGRHVTESQAFAVEFLASFFFVFVVFACYDKSSRSDCEIKVKPKVKEREQPFVIGLTYSSVLLFAVSSQFHRIRCFFDSSKLTGSTILPITDGQSLRMMMITTMTMMTCLISICFEYNSHDIVEC